MGNLGTEVTVNKEQGLYVIPAVNARTGKVSGYSCWGFENCHREAQALAKELGEPAPAGELGSMKLYNEYKALLAKAEAKHAASGWRSQTGLDPKLIGLEGQYVEVVNSVGETERFYVGRSTGLVPIHLAIKRQGASGGGGVLGPVKSVRVLPKPRARLSR